MIENIALRPRGYSIQAEKCSYNEQMRADDDIFLQEKKNGIANKYDSKPQ